MNQSPAGASDSDKALRLFQYLARLTELRSKIVTDAIESYEQVLWFGDVPDEPECSVVRTIEDGAERTFWMKVQRPAQVSFPEPPEECRIWVDVAYIETPGDFPALKSEITVLEDFEDPDEGIMKRPTTRLLEEVPDIVSSWEDYRKEWVAWSTEKIRSNSVRSTYSKLYSIHEEAVRRSEQFELLVGVGFLTWKASNGPIRRHLLTIPAEIGLDASTGHITVSPVAGSHLSLEEEMLSASDAPPRQEMASPVNDLKELGTSIFSSNVTEEALSAWLFSTHENGEFEKSFIPEPKIFSKSLNAPLVSMAPALILRKRTQRSLLRMYESISKTIEEDNDVPDNIIDLIEARSTEYDPTDKILQPSAPSRTFFPLPSNAAQESIIENLERSRGVVAQGPPGTGKSHTIANLISHLLAEGKRVLVTSHTDQALKVLRDKIPENLAELCVGVVGSGKDGASDLEKSIIALDREHSKNSWEDNLKAAIEKAEKDLEDEEEKRVSLLAQARDFRRTQIEICGYGKYRTTPSLSAALLKEDSRHSWLADSAEGEPLPAESVSDLRELFKKHDAKTLEESSKELVRNPPEPSTVSSLIKEIEAIKESLPDAPNPYASKLTPLITENRNELSKLLKDLEMELSKIQRFEGAWVKSVTHLVLGGSVKRLNALKNAALQALNALDRLKAFETYHVTYADPTKRSLLLAQGNALHVYLSAGGKLKKFGRSSDAAKRASIFLEQVSVAGNPVSTAKDCFNAMSVIAIESEIQDAFKEWGNELEIPSSPSKQREVMLEALTEIAEIEWLHSAVGWLNELFIGLHLDEPQWASREVRNLVAQSLSEIETQELLLEKESSLSELTTSFELAILKPNSSPFNQVALDAINAKKVKKYAKAYDNILRVNNIQAEIKLKNELLEKLSLRAPVTLEDLRETFMDKKWDARIENLSEAWDWKRSSIEREEILGTTDSNLAIANLNACDEKIRSLIGELAKSKAWLHALRRLTPKDLQHLRAYKEALKRLGKGSGKSAATERRNAQTHMDAAQGAVPAWIMPIYRIADTLAPERHAFDVVIVDEASQSGVEALFLMWMAKKIVVVGDDKQISPENVGIKTEGVEELQKQYLFDIPMQDNFSLKSSFFDQASVRYQGRIMLSEHFRCMPEIIEFSNRLMYNGKLVPLKQFGKDRLDPLKATYVPGAEEVKKGSQSFNEEEAKAIVDAIVDCIADPAYAGRSFGVISLKGLLQAQRIESMLLEKLGVEEMLARNLRCSDAPGFQGDERDVIFLSLVSAPSASGGRIPALGDFKYSQRFNVAASRAESQMWLFHSVRQDELNPSCPRSKLLQHVTNLEKREVSEELKGVTRDTSHDLFDSLFEQKVYLDIIARGYEVVPQWEALGRRIDLVVVGEHGRLAVECDGDYWHGPEQYEADLARERDLQRVGWEFFRVRGSDYYLNEEKSLLPLWEMLESRGITPKGCSPTPSVKKDASITHEEHGPLVMSSAEV